MVILVSNGLDTRHRWRPLLSWAAEILCRPLRSTSCWVDKHWNSGKVQVLLHKAQHKTMCPSCDSVINSLNRACRNFEIARGIFLWYTAGFGWGTPRDTHTHKYIPPYITYTLTHATVTPEGAVSCNTRCYTLEWSFLCHGSEETKFVRVCVCRCVCVCLCACILETKTWITN